MRAPIADRTVFSYDGDIFFKKNEVHMCFFFQAIVPTELKDDWFSHPNQNCACHYFIILKYTYQEDRIENFSE